jgi:S-adenosylmethionine synthetase (AdoMet synthetase)
LSARGTGHPDTIGDAILEGASVAVCREYLATIGRVLHHNLDKGLQVAGRTQPRLVGGQALEPMRLVFGDRATAEYEQASEALGAVTDLLKHRDVQSELWEVLPTIAASLIKTGQVKQVMELIKTWLESRSHVSYDQVVPLLQAVGEVKNSQMAAELGAMLVGSNTIESAEQKAKLLADLARILAQCGNEEVAAIYADDAISELASIDDAGRQAETSGWLIATLNRIVNSDVLPRLVEWTLSSIQMIESRQKQVLALTRLAQAAAGDVVLREDTNLRQKLSLRALE